MYSEATNRFREGLELIDGRVPHSPPSLEKFTVKN